MRRTTWMSMVLAGALAFGCDGDPEDPDGGPPMEDSGTPPDEDGGPPPPVDSGPVDDGNDTFADADPIEVDTPVEGAAIATPGDLDYYSFTGTEGQWVSINAVATPSTNMLDTVVTLYDSSMTQIAENDDAQPRGTGAGATNSEIITRLPADGTYYVLVQEFSSWDADATPEGMPTFVYNLGVGNLDLESEIVNVDEEMGDDAASAQTMTFQDRVRGDVAITVGTFDDATDVDVWAVTVTDRRVGLRFTLMPVGPDGYGSTTTPASMWITNSDGSEIIARIDPTMLEAPQSLSPPLPEGDYLFWIQNGTPGSNDHYVLKPFRPVTDNEPEMNETLNDVAATAEAVTLEPDEGMPEIRRYFLLSTLTDGDTDHYSVTVNDGEAISVFCGSRTAGSGVIDLTVALLDSTGATEIATATETATESAVIEEGATASGTTTYLVRLTKGSQDTEVTGNWARCQILAAPPAP